VGAPDAKLFRRGAYPPLRGTFSRSTHVRRSSIRAAASKFFGTYPGTYIPQPLGLRCDRTESTPKELAEEVLALTKMNWNNAQFDGHDPITVRAARQVGKILKYIGPDEPVEPRYAHYM
jgi:argonaute-like protein implicated in RNA metabolism and viral defense